VPQTYSITAPNGKTLDVTGDHVPTEPELHEIFKTAGVDTAAPASSGDEAGPLLRGAQQFYEKSPIGAAVGLGTGLANVIAHPLDTYLGAAPIADAVKGAVKAQWDQAVTAAQKVKAAAHAAAGGQGTEAALSATEALGHGLAAILPILGPAAADVGEHGARGDVAGMVGGAAGLLTPFAAKYGLETKAPNLGKADRLTREAEAQVSQRVLAPGNPRFKGTAAALAPQILDRGLQGDRIALQQLATEGMDTAGSHIDQTVSAHGGPQAPVATTPIVDAMTKRINDLTVNGTPIPTAAGRVASLTKLRDYVQGLGKTAPFESIKAIRDDFYGEAAKQSGYEASGRAPLADAAWAAREGGSAIREALATDRPDTAAHYAEYTFWKNLNDVLDPTLGRPKSGTVTTGVTGGLHTTGAIIGAAAGSGIPGVAPLAALAVSKLLPAIREAQVSPGWQLAQASKKLALAKAIKAGNVGVAKGLLFQITNYAPRGLDAAASGATAGDPASTPAGVASR
jgi:hypothetical protein